MRGFRGNTRQFGGSFAAGAVQANTINITHITQVVPGCSNGGRTHLRTRAGRTFGGRFQRPSELPRYLYEGRAPGELCKESVRTLGISARGFGSCADDLAHHAGGVIRSAGGVVKGAVGLIAAFCGKDIF